MFARVLTPSVCKSSVHHIWTIVPSHTASCPTLLAFSPWVDGRCHLAVTFGDGSLVSYPMACQGPSPGSGDAFIELAWGGSTASHVAVGPGDVVVASDDVLVSCMAWQGHTLAIAKPASLSVWVPGKRPAKLGLESAIPASNLMWVTPSYLHAVDMDGKYDCFEIDVSVDPIAMVSLEGSPALDFLRDTLSILLLNPILRISDTHDDEGEEQEDGFDGDIAPSSRFGRVFGAVMSPNRLQVAVLFSQYVNRLEYCINSTDFAHVVFLDISSFSRAIKHTPLLEQSLQSLRIPSGMRMCSFMWDYLLTATHCFAFAAPSHVLQDTIATVLRCEARAWEEAPASPTTENFAKVIMYLYHSLKESGMAQSEQFLPLRDRAASLIAYNMVCHLVRLHDCLNTFNPPPHLQSRPFVATAYKHIHTIGTLIEKRLSLDTACNRWSRQQIARLKEHTLEKIDERCPICSRVLPFGNFIQAECQHGNALETPTIWKRCQITFNLITSFHCTKCSTCGALVVSSCSEMPETVIDCFLLHYSTHFSPSLASSIVSPFGLRCPHCAAQIR